MSNAVYAEAFRALITMSIAGSAVAIILFILKPILKNRLPKTAQYYLWLIVLTAMLVPFSKIVTFPPNAPVNAPVSSFVAMTVRSADELREARAQELGASYAELSPVDQLGVQMDTSTTVRNWQRNWIMAAIPAVGIWIFLYTLFGYFVFSFNVKRTRHTAGFNETEVLAELCGKKSVPGLYKSEKTATPMLMGLFNPVIVLPERQYTETQLRNILIHELTHLRKKDILVKWLSVIACSLHWFNPLAWLVRREIDRACELACDEEVIRKLDVSGKQFYGDTLIAVAADIKMPHTVISTTMCERKKSLKERLGAIMEYKKTTHFTISLSFILIVLVGAGALLLGAGSVRSPFGVNIPAVYALSSTGASATALTFSYTWDGGAVDTIAPWESEYKAENTLYAPDGIITLHIDSDGIESGGVELYLPGGIPVAYDGQSLIIKLPDGADEYICVVDNKYSRDNLHASYGFKVTTKLWADIYAISALKTPYVGASSAVAKIVNLLPLPDSRLTQKFMSIGDDYGTATAPNTLTIYYEPRSAEIQNATAQRLENDNAYHEANRAEIILCEAAERYLKGVLQSRYDPKKLPSIPKWKEERAAKTAEKGRLE
ncbi:MAG: DUF4825 domain-containing protein, partial [Syntrophomonadaceae bacterium]|nr:DUF4825 domain-containing protein [Syntrophomonadaceae bacterium]